MANPRKRRRAKRSHNSHRRRHRRHSNPAVRASRSHRKYGRRRRSSNPHFQGFGLVQVAKMGAGAALSGIVVPKIADMVLGANNVGFVGYAGDIGATLVAAVASNKFLGKDFTTGIIAGGIGQLIARIYADYGGQLRSAIGLSGMGEYVSSQFPLPSVSQKVGTHYLTPAAVAALPSPKGKTMGRVSRFQSRFQ